MAGRVGTQGMGDSPSSFHHSTDSHSPSTASHSSSQAETQQRNFKVLSSRKNIDVFFKLFDSGPPELGSAKSS